MRRAILFTMAMALFSLTAAVDLAADEVQAEEIYSTNIEAFLNQNNVLVIKDVYILGKVTGLYSSSGLIRAIITYKSGERESRLKGLLFEVSEGQSGEKSQASFLDIEEIEGLSAAIASMVKMAEERAKTENFYTEISYKTRDGLSFGVYLGESENEGLITTSGSEKLTIFMEPSKMDEVKRIVDYGYTLLKMK